MQIFPNVYEIKSPFGDRYLQQYLFVGESVVLVDAGVMATPQEAIFPYLEKMGSLPTGSPWLSPCTPIRIIMAVCQRSKTPPLPRSWRAMKAIEK